MANKVCKRDYFSAIRTVIEANPELRFGTEKFPEMPVADVLAFIDNELSLLNSKSGALKKPTEKQTQNEGFKSAIADYLVGVAPAHKSISEIWTNVSELADCPEMTGQRISALLTQLIKVGEVVRVEEKRKAYFKAA